MGYFVYIPWYSEPLCRVSATRINSMNEIDCVRSFFAVFCIYLTVIISVPLRYGYGLEYAIFMHLLSLVHLSVYVIWLRTKIWRAMGERVGWSRLSKRSWYALFSTLFLLQVYLFSEITGNREMWIFIGVLLFFRICCSC